MGSIEKIIVNNIDYAIDGSKNNYGTCSTAAATATKEVTVAGVSVLSTGSEVVVKFANTNTASSPKLNVNSLGAKDIYNNGQAINASDLKENRTYAFRYNGTQWDLVGNVSNDSWTGTQAEYELEKDNIEPGTIVNITDDEEAGGSGLTAADILYDNTSSGSSSTNTQGAIDEIFSDLSEKLIDNLNVEITALNASVNYTNNALIDAKEVWLIFGSAKNYYINIKNVGSSQGVRQTYVNPISNYEQKITATFDFALGKATIMQTEKGTNASLATMTAIIYR